MNTIKVFSTRHPFLFALIFFVITFCLNTVLIAIMNQSVTTMIRTIYIGLVAVILQSLLALGVLIRLGWLSKAGFNKPPHWHNLHLLWVPVLLAMFYISSAFATPVGSVSVIFLAVAFALLAGLNEEASFRGVILQALSPYGSLLSATASGLFFGLAHLNNLLTHVPVLIVLGQVLGGFLLGFGFAACRLRTRTIWPLIILHALYDLPANITLFNVGSSATVYSMLANLSPLTVAVGLIAPGFVLACYGLFLLRPRMQATQQLEVPS